MPRDQPCRTGFTVWVPGGACTKQEQRWLATALLEIEPRLRRLRGYRALPQLRIALKTAVMQGKEVRVA